MRDDLTTISGLLGTREESSVPHFTTDICNRFFDYWQSLRHDGGLPGRADFEPGSIPALISQIMILELPRPGCAVFRLVGSVYDQRFGANLTGRDLFDFIPDPIREIRARQMWHAVTAPCGLRLRHGAIMPEGHRQEEEYAVLPIHPRDPSKPMQLISVGQPLSGEWRRAQLSQIADLLDRVDYVDLGAKPRR